MRNTTKIQDFIEAVATLIQAGAPGFVDRLPSRRELAAQYGISAASVQIALQELEKRGLVENIPQKGSRVIARSTGMVQVSRRQPEVIEVTVFENLPHQTRFWLDRFRAFERLNPSCKVRARFCDSTSTAVPAETRAVLRLPRLTKYPPMVPLNEIYENDRFDAIRNAAIGQFADWDWSLFLPYQVQMHALIYRGPMDNPLVPIAGESVIGWLGRLRTQLGERSLLPPRNDWLAAICGVIDVAARSLAGFEASDQLFNYFQALAFYAANNLINHEISPEEPHAPLLRSHKLAGLIDFTHHWNSFRLLEPESEFQIAPLPFASGATNGVFVARAALFGTARITTAERLFFEYLVSPEFQFAQMTELMGLSPFSEQLCEGQSRMPKLAPLIECYRRQPFRPCSEEIWTELSERLMEPVLLPLIAGEISAETGRRIAAPLIASCYAARRSAKKHFLRSFLCEVV